MRSRLVPLLPLLLLLLLLPTPGSWSGAGLALAHGDRGVPLEGIIRGGGTIETWSLVCPDRATFVAVNVCPRPGASFPAGQPFTLTLLDPGSGRAELRTSQGDHATCLWARFGRGARTLILIARPTRGAFFRYTTSQACFTEEDELVRHATTRHRLLQDE